MFETGIFDVTRFYHSKFLVKTLFSIKNKRKLFLTSRQKADFDFDQFKLKTHDKFNIICMDLKLERFEFAIKF